MSDIGKRYIDSAEAYLLAVLEKQHQKTEELKQKLNTDPLTGLYSKNFMEAEARVLDSQRIDAPYGIVAIDVDSFKTSANDSYGHEVGDKVLVAVANALRETFRPTDSCCRPGGDEFVVIIPEFNSGVDVEVLQASLERRLTDHIHRTFSEELAQYPKLKDISISVGLSSTDEGQNFNDIKNKADQKMYNNKRNKGKSR